MQPERPSQNVRETRKIKKLAGKEISLLFFVDSIM